LNTKFAGGSPAAGHFLLYGQKKVTKENAAPGSPALRAPLRCSRKLAAAELALAIPLRGLRQSSPTPPVSAVLLGDSQGDGWYAIFGYRRMPVTQEPHRSTTTSREFRCCLGVDRNTLPVSIPGHPRITRKPDEFLDVLFEKRGEVLGGVAAHQLNAEVLITLA
jgi:hypothetical protein